jgi:hypothetical protein
MSSSLDTFTARNQFMTNMLSRIFGRSESQPKTIRVLVVGGGGVRGIVTGEILGRLESAMGGRLRDHFDLMAGTSSGGISVMALATDSLSDAYELSTIFSGRAKDVFRRAPNPVRLPPLLRGPRYLADGFLQVATDVLGHGWLSDCKVPTLVTSYLIEEGRLKLFGSLNEDFDDDYKLVDVARATTAAPAYFPPAYIVSREGKGLWGIDGGVYANTPILQAITEARRRFGRECRIEVVSVGAGDTPITVKPGPAQQWGGISWLKPAFDIHVLALAEQTHAFVRDQLPDVRLHRLEVEWETLPKGMRPTSGLDDYRPRNLACLHEGSLRWLDNNDAKIKAVRTALLQASLT